MTRYLRLQTLILSLVLGVVMPAHGGNSNNRNDQNQRNDSKQDKNEQSDRAHQRRLKSAYEARLRAIAEDLVSAAMVLEDRDATDVAGYREYREQRVDETYRDLKKVFENVRKVPSEQVSQAPSVSSNDAIQRRQEERKQEDFLREDARRRVTEQWARMGEDVEAIDVLKNGQSADEAARELNRRQMFYKDVRREYLGLLKAKIDSEVR